MDFTTNFKNKLKNLIKNNFSIGELFDSHTVINLILKEKDFYTLYLENYPKHSEINLYHSEIAKEIENTGLAEKFSKDSHFLKIKTLTNFDEVSPNTLWIRK